VIKKDGRKERFDIDKIRKGIELAFEKRPVKEEEINKMMNNIEEQIRKLREQLQRR
jgi:transcriptional repressor NrdR